MPDIQIQVTIAASSENVHLAITEHLKDWWAPQVMMGGESA